MRYTERLAQRIATVGSPLCVGLDPRPERLDGGDVEAHLRQVIDETAELAAAFKPNLAYFEAMGLSGLSMLERVIDYIPDAVPIVLDAKRSDTAETQKYYAKAYFEHYKVDSVTVNPFMGYDSIEPFLGYEGKGVYLLALTSNAGSADLMRKEVEGKPMYLHVADFAERAAECPTDVGFVMGLTNLGADEVAAFPDYPLLIPGLGAQGGDLAALSAGAPRQAPNLINASRAVLFPADGDHRAAAQACADQLKGL